MTGKASLKKKERVGKRKKYFLAQQEGKRKDKVSNVFFRYTCQACELPPDLFSSGMTLPIFCCIRLEEQKWSVHLVLPYTETVTWVEKFISILENKSIAQCCALLQQCSCYLYQSFQWHIDLSKKKKEKIPFLDPAMLAQPADTDQRGTAVLLSSEESPMAV